MTGPGAPAARPKPPGLARQIAAALPQAGAGALARAVFASGLYRLTLRGPMPDSILFGPPDLRPASAERGTEIAAGRFDLGGGRLEAGTASPFRLAPPSPAFAEALHGFGWLRHLAVAPVPDAGRRAQGLAQAWLDACGRWHPVAWRPDVIACRLTAWASHAALLFADADPVLRSALLRSMAAQARHLSRTAPYAPEGLPRLTAAAGLALSGLSLAEGRTRVARGLALLERQLTRQILPDGGHVSRNPESQLEMLTVLVTLRDGLMARDIEVPAALRNAIDRAMPMLRFFRHGDGRLALFNGGGEGVAAALDAVLARDDARGRPFGFAPHSGYQRLAAGRTLLLVDAGGPPPPPHAADAHAGCLGFEMSAGRYRLVVNCGPARGRGPDWDAATRATAAHSTVTVADTSSARILRRAWQRRLLGGRLVDGPRSVESRRSEDGGAIAVDMRHDGYLRRFGLEHERRILLSADGDTLGGEDTLFRPGTPPRPWWDPFGLFAGADGEDAIAIRFHLHPDVRASLAHDGTQVLALLPNGDGWQIRASGNADLTLEDSIYLGREGRPRRTRQVVMSHHVFRGEAQIRWSFRRLTARNPDVQESIQAEAFAQTGETPNRDADA